MNDKANPSDEDQNEDDLSKENIPIFASAAEDEQNILPITYKRAGVSPIFIGAGIGVVLFIIAISSFMLLRGGFNSNRNEADNAPPTPDIISPYSYDFPATQTAWRKPQTSPIIGTYEEAKRAVIIGDVAYLDDLVIGFPNKPKISQPGDLYVIYAESFNQSAIATYGWCAASKEALDDNFEQTEIKFEINESKIPFEFLFPYDESIKDGSNCWSYNTLIKSRPSGVHRLDIRVTFTQEVNDGWNVYPKGTHTHRYFISILP